MSAVAAPAVGRLVILGVGLIGGSLALAARRARACAEVVGWGRRRETLERARALGVVDRCETDLARALAGADVVVVAVPPGAMEGLFQSIADLLEMHTIVTDVGSTKGSVVAAARVAFGRVLPNFVPGHPIAGTEQSGVDAAFADLFLGRRVILTPLPETEPAALSRVRRLWELCGAQVVEMDVDHHDQVLAGTSHLPHLLAFALVDTLARVDDSWEIFRYAAGGFRDFTRIASSDPHLWCDIAMANRHQLLVMVEHLRDELDLVANAIATGDGTTLLDVLSRAKRARDHFSRVFAQADGAPGQSTHGGDLTPRG